MCARLPSRRAGDRRKTRGSEQGIPDSSLLKIQTGPPCKSLFPSMERLILARTSTLPKRLQPMLATLTHSAFDHKDWIFEDKYDGFRMVATIEGGEVMLYSRNGKIITDNYIEVATALQRVKRDAVIDGELVAIGIDGVSHFQLLQNARRREAKL